jgi:predicted O-methyltransferase YrrM
MENIIKNLMCSGSNCIEGDFFSKNFENGVVTHCSYKGISMEQNPNVIFAFEKLFDEIKPDLVLEIGTFHGGLTLMLRDILNHKGLENTRLITYDVNSPNFLIQKTTEDQIEIRVKNLFSHNYSDWNSSEDRLEILDLITSHKSVVILCDGGSKKNEFRMISDLIKQGDIIMGHDYSPNQEYFDQYMDGKKWNWMEIQDSDIEESVSKNNLKPYMNQNFLDVAWVCKIK